MDITFACEKCGQSIVTDEAAAGQLVDCPKCGTPLAVPYKSKSSDKVATPSLDKGGTKLDKFLDELDKAFSAKPRQTEASTFTEALGAGEILPAEKAHEKLTEASPLPECGMATALTCIAVLEFVVAPIAGLLVGQENVGIGFIIFVSGILSGIFILGFASALRYLHAIAYRLERNESLLTPKNQMKAPTPSR